MGIHPVWRKPTSLRDCSPLASAPVYSPPHTGLGHGPEQISTSHWKNVLFDDAVLNMEKMVATAMPRES